MAAYLSINPATVLAAPPPGTAVPAIVQQTLATIGNANFGSSAQTFALLNMNITLANAIASNNPNLINVFTAAHFAVHHTAGAAPVSATAALTRLLNCALSPTTNNLTTQDFKKIAAIWFARLAAFNAAAFPDFNAGMMTANGIQARVYVLVITMFLAHNVDGSSIKQAPAFPNPAQVLDLNACGNFLTAHGTHLLNFAGAAPPPPPVAPAIAAAAQAAIVQPAAAVAAPPAAAVAPAAAAANIQPHAPVAAPPVAAAAPATAAAVAAAIAVFAPGAPGANAAAYDAILAAVDTERRAQAAAAAIALQNQVFPTVAAPIKMPSHSQPVFDPAAQTALSLTLSANDQAAAHRLAPENEMSAEGITNLMISLFAGLHDQAQIVDVVNKVGRELTRKTFDAYDVRANTSFNFINLFINLVARDLKTIYESSKDAADRAASTIESIINRGRNIADRKVQAAVQAAHFLGVAIDNKIASKKRAIGWSKGLQGHAEVSSMEIMQALVKLPRAAPRERPPKRLRPLYDNPPQQGPQVKQPFTAFKDLCYVKFPDVSKVKGALHDKAVELLAGKCAGCNQPRTPNCVHTCASKPVHAAVIELLN